MATISIVDNDQDNVTCISEMLQLKGHKLSFFTSSSAFLNSLVKKQPEMIIIGVELDGDEDGRVLSKHLQTETPYKNIPVILTSPYYHTEGEIRNFCCDDLVSMPFDDGRLSTSVEVLLAKEQAKAARLEKA